MKYSFVVLEGTDLVGKTTVARELARIVGGRYVSTPTAPLGNVRGLIDVSVGNVSRFLFYLTSVAIASEQIAKLLLTSHVICDRYIYSTLAYHEALGVDVSLVDMKKLQLTIPDLYVHLKANDEVKRQRLLERFNASASDRSIEDDHGLQQRVEAVFDSFSMWAVDTSSRDASGVAFDILEKVHVVNGNSERYQFDLMASL